MLNYQRVKKCDFCETNANRRIATNPSCFHVSEQKGISVLTHPHIKNGCSQVSSIPNMVFSGFDTSPHHKIRDHLGP